MEAGNNWEGDDGPAEKDLASVPHVTGQELGGSANLHRTKWWEPGQSRKGYKQAAVAEEGGGEECGFLPSPSTFLFPRWGWEIIGNDSRIPFLPFLWFWFLLLGRERI